MYRKYFPNILYILKKYTPLENQKSFHIKHVLQTAYFIADDGMLLLEHFLYYQIFK